MSDRHERQTSCKSGMCRQAGCSTCSENKPKPYNESDIRADERRKVLAEVEARIEGERLERDEARAERDRLREGIEGLIGPDLALGKCVWVESLRALLDGGE